jgi:hypothetical protein
MTGRIAAVLAASVALGVGSAGCQTFFEIPVEIPMQAKMDVSVFQRVLVAGFVSGGTRSIDPNTETARLLRSQLRSKSDLKVIDADVLSLVDEIDRQRRLAGTAPPVDPTAAPEAVKIKTAEEMEAYEAIFTDEAFWKRIGEEYQSPLIITGSMLFSEISKVSTVSKLESYKDEVTGETKYREVRTEGELKGWALDTKLVFLDGRSGKPLHTETIREETLYEKSANTPALSAYFELMDKILPTFLNTLSTQKHRGTRILIK